MIYSYDDKVRIARKIEALRNKKVMLEIVEFMKQDPKYVQPIHNMNGTFMLFHQLGEQTYEAIEALLNKHKPPVRIKQVSVDLVVQADEIDTQKLSNHEVFILKKKYKRELDLKNWLDD